MGAVEGLRSLLATAPDVRRDGQTAFVGVWCCEVRDGRLRWSRTDGRDDATDDGLDALRAACAVAWAAQDAGTTIEGTTGNVPDGCSELF